METTKLAEKEKRINLFLDLVLRIIESRHIYGKLYPAEKANGVLTTSSARFFSFLLMLLMRDFYLEAAKILDPPTTKVNGAERDNLTVRQIVEKLEWTPAQKLELSKYKEKLIGFNPYLREARNRIIAHNDLETCENDVSEVVEGFDVALETDFVGTLKGFSEYLHKVTFGKTWGKYVPGCPNGVNDLRNDLYRARAFEKILNDPQIDNEIKNLLAMSKSDCERSKK